MGRTRRTEEKTKCKFCQGDFDPKDRPYISKQAGMQGDYHWSCFVAACRDRVPVSIGAIDLPAVTAEAEEPETESAPASAEE